MNDSLKPVIDTIHRKVIIDTVRLPSKDSMELLYRLDSFYNNSWGKLIVLVTIAFTVLGIIVPLLIQWYQKREMKLSEGRLKSEIENKISGAIIEVQKTINESFEKELIQLRCEIKGLGYHLQAGIKEDRKDFPKAVRDYIRAMQAHLEAGDLSRAINASSGIVENIGLCEKTLLDNALKSVSVTLPDALDALIKNYAIDGLNTNLLKAITLYQSLK